MKLAGKKFPFWAIEIKGSPSSTTDYFNVWRITGLGAGRSGTHYFKTYQNIRVSNYYISGKRTGWAHFSKSYAKTLHKSTVYKMKDPNTHYKSGIIVALFGSNV